MKMKYTYFVVLTVVATLIVIQSLINRELELKMNTTVEVLPTIQVIASEFKDEQAN